MTLNKVIFILNCGSQSSFQQLPLFLSDLHTHTQSLGILLMKRYKGLILAGILLYPLQIPRYRIDVSVWMKFILYISFSRYDTSIYSCINFLFLGEYSKLILISSASAILLTSLGGNYSNNCLRSSDSTFWETKKKRKIYDRRGNFSKILSTSQL